MGIVMYESEVMLFKNRKAAEKMYKTLAGDVFSRVRNHSNRPSSDYMQSYLAIVYNGINYIIVLKNVNDVIGYVRKDRTIS